MNAIRYIEPAALHDEMLRLRQEEQMDFLECLTGMDWGEPDTAKDTPDTPRGLGVVYQLESTVTGKRVAVRHRHSRPGTSRTPFRLRHLESRRLPGT